MNYDQVLELREITKEDCDNLYRMGKRVIINDGEIINIIDEDE